MSENYPDIIGGTVNLAAPDTYGATGQGFKIASDGEGKQGILNDGYVDGGTIYNAGLITSATISKGGVINVLNYNAGATLFKDIVVDGGTVSGPRKPDGTNDGAIYYVDGLTVNGGSFGYVWRCSVTNFTIYDGTISLHSGGLSGGTIHGGIVSGYGSLFSLQDVYMDGGTIQHGNAMSTISLTMVDGVLNTTISANKVSASVIKGGTVTLAGNCYNRTWAKNLYNDNTIYGGTVDVQGGHITNLAISGGTVTFVTSDQHATGETGNVYSSGAFLSGAIILGGTAQVKVVAAKKTTINYNWINDSYANWVFDLSNRPVAFGGTTALIDDFGFTGATTTVGGTEYKASYSISVKSDQAEGIYKLAGNAAAMTGKTFTISVDGATGADIVVGTPEEETSLETAFATYKLTVSADKDLTLSVTPKTLYPVMILKDNQLVNGGTSFEAIKLGAGTSFDGDQMFVSGGTGTVTNTVVEAGGELILTGGTVQNTTYSGGIIRVEAGQTIDGLTIGDDVAIVVDYAVKNLNAPEATTVMLSSGASVDGGTINLGATGRVDVKSDAKISNATINITAEGGTMFVSAGAVANNITVYNKNSNGLQIYGTVNDLTLSGNGGRIGAGGVVNGATVQDGILKIFEGTLTGKVDVSAGAYVDFAYKTGVLSAATVNLSAGATLLANHSSNTAEKHPTFSDDSVVNVSNGAVFTNMVELNMNGTVNLLKGGYINNATITAGHSGMSMGETAKINIDVIGAYTEASKAAVRSFNNFDDGNKATFTVIVDNLVTDDYYIMADASDFASKVNVTVGGTSIGAIGLDESIIENGYKYQLTLDDSNNVVFSISETGVWLYQGETITYTASVSDITLDGVNVTQLVVYDGGTATSIVNKNGTLLQSGGILTGLGVAGGTTTLEDGSAKNVVISNGAKATIYNTVDDLILSAGGTMVLSNGAMVTDAYISALNAGALIVNGTAIIDGGTIKATGGASAAQITGIIRNVEVAAGGSVNCFVVNGNGRAENMTFRAGARISGTVKNADIYNGLVRIFNSGKVQGTINVYGGTIDMTYSGAKIDGTVNLIGKGTYVLTDHTNASLNTEITVNGAVNLAEGTYIGKSNGAVTNLTINGKINVNGGQVKNGALVTGKAWIFGTTGSLNFNLAGLTAAKTAYVASYNSLNKAADAETGTAFTINVNTDGTVGDYILFGDASKFSDRGQTISVSINGGEAKNFSIGTTYNDVVNCRNYELKYDETTKNVTFSVTAVGGTVAETTGAIPLAGGTVATATWDSTTSYSTGKVYVGNTNTDATNTVLFINNTSTTATAKTYVFGGVNGGTMTGEADIRLYQGNIGAICGGAVAGGTVGAVDVQIGGGTAAATTTVVYGGGFGNVTGNIKVTTSKNANVTGQFYGGSFISTGSTAGVTIGGDITVDFAGGTLAGDVAGGARVAANAVNTTTVEGAVSLTIEGADFTGGEDASIYGGGWVVGQGTEAARSTGEDYSQGDVTISITSEVALGSGNGRGIFGGSFAANYAVAEVGNVDISVTGTTVTNVFGGGWAQSGAKSNVDGDVKITLTGATASAVYGGGAHASNSEVSGKTNISKSVSITINNSTVDKVFAVGQTTGDTITGSASVTVTGGSKINTLRGCGFNSYKGAASSTLKLIGFTGTISEELLGFDSITISGNSTAKITAANGAVNNKDWNFDLTDNTSESAALTWQNGQLEEDTVQLYLSSTNTGNWVVCNLYGDDDVKENAVDGTTFNIYIDDVFVKSTTFSETVRSYQISGTGTRWDNATLAYTEDDGVLKFTLAQA